MSTVLSNIVKKEELREVQLNTLEKIASVVGETAGPAGSYVMILNDGTNNVFTKDGHKALSSIKFHSTSEVINFANADIKTDLETYYLLLDIL